MCYLDKYWKGERYRVEQMSQGWSSSRRVKRQLIISGAILLFLLMLTGRSIFRAIWSLVSSFFLVALVLVVVVLLLWVLDRYLQKKRR